MYFAQNPPSPGIPAEIADAIGAFGRQNNALRVYALIDCAHDEQFFASTYRRPAIKQSLYEQTSLESLGRLAPFLLQAPVQGDGLLNWLQDIFALCGQRPMLSIVCTGLDIDAFARHMRPYLVAITEDTMRWPVRWADTRVLPMLLAALTPPQRDHLLSPVYGWWAVDRKGEGIAWEGGQNARPEPAGFDQLPLRDAGFASLVEQAEPDAILAGIDEAQPDVLRDLSPAWCHARVASHLKIASAHGIESARDRHHFCVLALLLRDGFVSDPAIADVLNQTRLGGAYMPLVASLPQNFWNDWS